MIVDTNVLIRILQNDRRAISKVAEVEEEYGQLRISSMSEFELYHSIERVTNPAERRREIEAVLDTKTTYPADSTVMKKAGRIDGRLTAAGNEIGMADVVIAATALVNEEPVLTENVRHFDRVDGLTVETY